MKHTKTVISFATLGVFFLVLVVGVLSSRQTALPTGSWGLSFPNEGSTPVGSASPAQLARYDAVFVGDETGKQIYLTFDAGYENGNTATILDVLKKHNAPAAFFVVGPYIERNPALVQRMADEGHIVGNHTWHHYDMSKLEDEAVFSEELETVAAAYESLTGRPMPRYYRPPQGIYSEENLKMAQKLGYRTVFWSLAYRDWLQDEQPTSEQAFAKLLPRIHNGAIVLLHSTSSTNAAILDELLSRYEALGYRFAPLDALYTEDSDPDGADADLPPAPF